MAMAVSYPTPALKDRFLILGVLFDLDLGSTGAIDFFCDKNPQPTADHCCMCFSLEASDKSEIGIRISIQKTTPLPPQGTALCQNMMKARKRPNAYLFAAGHGHNLEATSSVGMVHPVSRDVLL